MAFAVLLTNLEQITYYTTENVRRVAEDLERVALTVATGVQIAAQATAMVSFYNAADSAIAERDAKIDAQEQFMNTLEVLKDTQDLPMVNDKISVLTSLFLPQDISNYSSDFDIISGMVFNQRNGESVDIKSRTLARESCGGIPQGWATHDGLLVAARVAGYNSGILTNSQKRRVERFRSSKTSLVRGAHLGMKSLYNATDTLTKYAQAAAIHSGLADLYIQGFNSAGAGLGVSLGRLASGSGGDTTLAAPENLNPGVSLDAGTANNVEGVA